MPNLLAQIVLAAFLACSTQCLEGGARMNLGARTAMWSGGKKMPTARDYRGDFIIHLDGIENVGYGLPHQTEKLEWPSLVGDCVFKKRYGNWAWSDNALTSMKTDNFDTSPSYDLSSLGKVYTIEAIIDNKAFSYPRMFGIGNLFSMTFNRSGYGFFSTFGVACATGNDRIDVWGCPWTVKELAAANTVSVVADGEKARFYINGASDGKVYETELFGSGTNNRFDLGLRYGDANVIIHGLRVSRNALTVDDLGHNYAIDKARFGLP